MRILVLDNYDSFTHNLVGLLLQQGAHCIVKMSDCLAVEDVVATQPDAILIGPGPGGPTDAGISVDVVRSLKGQYPIFGVCLGLQVIAHAFGARVVGATRLMHGKTSWIHHDGCGLFAELPTPFEAMRYHSLVVEAASLPPGLLLSARDELGEVMALRHHSLQLEGVQFHPESFATPIGAQLTAAWLRSIERARTSRGDTPSDRTERSVRGQ